MIEIDHGNQLVSRYANTSRVFDKGTWCAVGRRLRRSARRVDPPGPHLHFGAGARVPQDPHAVSPPALRLAKGAPWRRGRHTDSARATEFSALKSKVSGLAVARGLLRAADRQWPCRSIHRIGRLVAPPGGRTLTHNNLLTDLRQSPATACSSNTQDGQAHQRHGTVVRAVDGRAAEDGGVQGARGLGTSLDDAHPAGVCRSRGSKRVMKATCHATSTSDAGRNGPLPRQDRRMRTTGEARRSQPWRFTSITLAGRRVHVKGHGQRLSGQPRCSGWVRLYSFLGLSVGVKPAAPLARAETGLRTRAITYGTNNGFGFDCATTWSTGRPTVCSAPSLRHRRRGWTHPHRRSTYLAHLISGRANHTALYVSDEPHHAFPVKTSGRRGRPAHR